MIILGTYILLNFNHSITSPLSASPHSSSSNPPHPTSLTHNVPANRSHFSLHPSILSSVSCMFSFLAPKHPSFSYQYKPYLFSYTSSAFQSSTSKLCIYRTFCHLSTQSKAHFARLILSQVSANPGYIFLSCKMSQPGLNLG